MDSVLLQTETNDEHMKKPLEIWHLVVAIVGILLIVFSAGISYTSNDAKIKENHEQRIKSLEDNKAEIRGRFDGIDAKLDKISDKIDNKQDKK